MIILMFTTAAYGSIPASIWNSAGISILTERNAVISALGTPDGTENTLEWYDISGNGGLSRVSLDFLDTGKVQAVSLAFAPGSIDLDTLCSIVMKAFPGTQEVIREDHIAIFLGKSTENDEPVYFLAMADDPGSGKGPELISMTEYANCYYRQQRSMKD